MFIRPIVLIAIALFSSPASPHLLKIAGDIGVLMHIAPSDAPVEREKATLFLEIKDRSNRFAPERCDCRLLISAGGKELFNDRIFLQGLPASAASFVFPAAGIYRVEVAGTPANGGDFQAFRVPFDVRVELNQGSQDSLGNALTQYWPIGTVLLLVLAGFAFVARKKK